MLRRKSLKRSRTEDNLALLSGDSRAPLEGRRSSQLSITGVHYCEDDGESSDGIGYDSDSQLGTRRRKSGRSGGGPRHDGKEGLTIVEALTSLSMQRGNIESCTSTSADKEESFVTSSSGGVSQSSELDCEQGGAHVDSGAKPDVPRLGGKVRAPEMFTLHATERREGSWRGGGLIDVPEVVPEESVDSP